jgi:hypothetical protein
MVVLFYALSSLLLIIKNNSYLASTVIKGRKEASHGLMTHLPICRVLKWTNGVHIPTLYYIPSGPTLKKEGLLHSGTPAGALHAPPGAPLALHRLSFRHMQGNTLGSNPMRQFKVVQGRFDPRARRGCHTDY